MRISLMLAAGLLLAEPAVAQNTDNAAAVADPAAPTANAAAPDTANTAVANDLATPPDAIATTAPGGTPADTAEPSAVVTADDDGFPWGVIGLVGLIGLLGRRRARD